MEYGLFVLNVPTSQIYGLPAIIAAALRDPVQSRRTFSIRARRVYLKCDAKRPHCSTCRISNQQDHCMYEEEAQRNLIQSLIARTRELEERLAASERDHLSVASISISQGVRVIPSWNPPVIEPPVPPAAPEDVVERIKDFRAYFVQFSQHAGVKLPAEAFPAFLAGDPFVPGVPPVLLHGTQLLGCAAWRDIERKQCQITFEIYEREATLLLLNEEGHTPLVVLQVHNCLMIYYFVRGLVSEGMGQVQLAAQVVRQHSLRFSPSGSEYWNPLLPPPPKAEEQAAALSHLLYVCISANLILGWPSDLGAEYEEEFSSVLLLYPNLSRSYLAVVRARTALLLQRTRGLSTAFTLNAVRTWDPQGQIPNGQVESAQLSEYWSLLEEVGLTLATISPALVRASMSPDQRIAVHGLKVCLIVALTAEAALHHIASRNHPDSKQQCLNSVLKLTGIGKTLTPADYQLFDPMLAECWIMAADIMFDESQNPADELCAMNWSTVRSVIIGSVPIMVKAAPFMETPLNRILERAESFPPL
ncbi:hypothetical protein C8Q79DRAFT_999844 [Trametes meyenii]|nr:hypothetical protein C8Q79DRAFT_999844 [Trametes meyenii]